MSDCMYVCMYVCDGWRNRQFAIAAATAILSPFFLAFSARPLPLPFPFQPAQPIRLLPKGTITGWQKDAKKRREAHGESKRVEEGTFARREANGK